MQSSPHAHAFTRMHWYLDTSPTHAGVLYAHCFVSTQLCENWKISRYIQSGAFGRGWVGMDLATKQEVFIKTFRSFSDRPPRNRADVRTQSAVERSQEAAIRKEIEVLLHPDVRLSPSSVNQNPQSTPYHFETLTQRHWFSFPP
jgi:hypothetical protein